MWWLISLLPLVSTQSCGPLNPDCPEIFTSPLPDNPCWRITLNGDSEEYCNLGRRVQITTKNRQAYFRCDIPEQLDCATVPKLNLGYNEQLKGLRFDNCGSNVSLGCIPESLNGSGVDEITLLKWTSDIYGDTFKGFNGLKTIMVFNSEAVTRVPTEMLKQFPLLTQIRFSETEISDLTSKMFLDLGLHNLATLHIIISKLTVLPAEGFVGLPKLHTLSLTQNNINSIDKDAFKDLPLLKNLYLDQNFIEDIPVDVLRYSPKLEVLTILRNRAGFRIKRDLFSELQYLETIEMSVDEGHITLEDEALSNLLALKTCKLSDARIQELPAKLFRGSRGLETLHLDGNEIETLPEAIFLDMENLKELSLSRNKLKSLMPENAPIYSGPFSSLTNLVSLSLSHNRLHTLSMATFVGTRASLKNLDLSYNQLSFDCFYQVQGVEVTENSTPLNLLTELESLDLSHNNLTNVCSDFRVIMTRLRDLNLANNKITTITEEEMDFRPERCRVDLRNNLITHIWPYTGVNKIEFLLNHNPFTCDCTNFDFFQNLNDINYDISNAKCSQPSQLKDVDLTSISILSKSNQYSLDNLVCELPDTPQNCKCLVRRSKNRTECLCDEGVDNLPSPVNITRYPFINKNDDKKYNMLLSLRSERNLELIPSFVSSLNLSYLNLNTIPDIPGHISHVNLSHNNLDEIPVELLSRNLTFDLGFNVFKCACSNVYDVENLQIFGYKISDYSDLICDDGIKVDAIQVPHLCDTYYSMAIGVTLAVGSLIAAILLIIMYIYKLEIKIFLYNKGLTCLNKEEAEDANKNYDIFISFCNDDEEYVLDVLMPILERKYKVCIHTRDFNIGEDVLTQIYRAVADSRRTIIVASDAYFRSSWCLQEITAAYKQTEIDQRTRAVVILRKGFDPKNVKLSETIKSYLNLNTWIKEEQNHFWNKLCYFLPRKITVEDLRVREVTRKAIENLGHINHVFASPVQDLNKGQVNRVVDKKSDDCDEVKIAVQNLPGGLEAVCKDGKLAKNLPDGLNVVCNGDGKLLNVAVDKGSK